MLQKRIVSKVQSKNVKSIVPKDLHHVLHKPPTRIKSTEFHRIKDDGQSECRICSSSIRLEVRQSILTALKGHHLTAHPPGDTRRIQQIIVEDARLYKWRLTIVQFQNSPNDQRGARPNLDLPQTEFIDLPSSYCQTGTVLAFGSVSKNWSKVIPTVNKENWERTFNCFIYCLSNM